MEEHFYTLVVSYSGFDETEKTTFISELDEVAKIEDYIEENLDGKLFAAYGCSLGGSFVSLLVDRQKIHIDHAIIGSSDMDQAPKWLAYLETSLMLPLIYPVMTGHPGKFMKKRMDKMLAANDEQAEYAKKFMAFMAPTETSPLYPKNRSKISSTRIFIPKSTTISAYPEQPSMFSMP